MPSQSEGLTSEWIFAWPGLNNASSPGLNTPPVRLQSFSSNAAPSSGSPNSRA